MPQFPASNTAPYLCSFQDSDRRVPLRSVVSWPSKSKDVMILLIGIESEFGQVLLWALLVQTYQIPPLPAWRSYSSSWGALGGIRSESPYIYLYCHLYWQVIVLLMLTTISVPTMLNTLLSIKIQNPEHHCKVSLQRWVKMYKSALLGSELLVSRACNNCRK